MGGIVAARLTRGGDALPSDVIARVNDVAIDRAEYGRLLDALASDRRAPLTAADRQHVLQRLIDEELLVQRGMELRIASSDRRLRSDLVTEVVSMVIFEAQDAQPEEAELRRFYEELRSQFIRPGPVRVRQLFFRVAKLAEVPKVESRARLATERLRRGEDLAVIRADLADPELVPLPDEWLSIERLRELLGPTVSRTIQAASVGAVSDPVRSGTGFHVVQVLDRQADAAPPLEQIRNVVVAEYRRQAGEQALRVYLDDLRKEAKIEIIEPANR